MNLCVWATIYISVIQQKEIKMDWISKIILILVVIGGLNWGLVGAFNFDLVAFLFGPMSVLSRIVYILVGLASVWVLFSSFYPTKELSK